MPRGRFKPHYKGRSRHFTSEEDVQADQEKKKRETEWKIKKGLPGDEEEKEGEGKEVEGATATGGTPTDDRGHPRDLPPSESGSEDSSSEGEESDKEVKMKGVEALIEVENPNRAAQKAKKVRDIDLNAKVELSRREREEIEKQRAAQVHRKLHEAGKTDEARRDMARLAIIRQQREDVARKRDAEKKAAAQPKKK